MWNVQVQHVTKNIWVPFFPNNAHSYRTIQTDFPAKIDVTHFYLLCSWIILLNKAVIYLTPAIKESICRGGGRHGCDPGLLCGRCVPTCLKSDALHNQLTTKGQGSRLILLPRRFLKNVLKSTNCKIMQFMKGVLLLYDLMSNSEAVDRRIRQKITEYNPVMVIYYLSIGKCVFCLWSIL